MKKLNKKKINISAELEINSYLEITPDVISDILLGIDYWKDIHNVDGKLYTSTLINPKQND